MIPINQITADVIEICINIHIQYGPGCFEKFYEEILYYELIKKGYDVERQVYLPIKHEIILVKDAYKTDLIVEGRLVIELKSLNPLPSVYFKQVRTQLTLLKVKHGMLINFKVEKMVEGIFRIFNNQGQDLHYKSQSDNSIQN